MDIEKTNLELAQRSVQNYAKRTQIERLRVLNDIFRFLYSEFGKKHILDYSFEEINALKSWIQSKTVGIDRKKKYILYLKIMVDCALQKLAAEGNYQIVAYWQYVLSNNIHFSENGTKREVIMVSPEEIKDFLRKLKEIDVENYILFSILAYSGCRIAGLINLTFNNIHFDRGVFFTQEKATKTSSGMNKYFLPLAFCKELQNYCIRNQISGVDHICPVSDKQIRVRLRKIKPNWFPHLFRHTFRTQLHLRGCPNTEAEFLLNHAVSNVQQVYLQQLKDENHLRSIYDRYFPY